MYPPHCSLDAGDGSSYPSLHGTLLIYLSFAPFQSHLHRLHHKPIFYPPFNFWCLQGDHLWSFPLLRSSPPLGRLIYFFDSEPRLWLMYPKSVSRETTLWSLRMILYIACWVSPLGILISTSNAKYPYLNSFFHLFHHPHANLLCLLLSQFSAVRGTCDDPQAYSRLLSPVAD